MGGCWVGMKLLVIFGGIFDLVYIGYFCVVWEVSELLDVEVYLLFVSVLLYCLLLIVFVE